MQNKTSQAEYFTDDTGRSLVRLPLSNSVTPAIAEAVMFDNAARREGGFGSFFLTENGSDRSYVLAYRRRDRKNKTLARLLLECPRGYRVSYLDGNPLNLLPENFVLRVGWADEETCMEVLANLVAAASMTEEEADAEG